MKQTSQTPAEFLSAVKSVIADVVAKSPFLFPATLFCQWADETGWHSMGCNEGDPKWRGQNNLAGISSNGIIANYANPEDFANAYVDAIGSDYYLSVHQAATVEEQMIALGESPWSTGHYRAQGQDGGALVDIYNSLPQTIIRELGLMDPNLVAEPDEPNVPTVAQPQKTTTKPELIYEPRPDWAEIKKLLDELKAQIQGIGGILEDIVDQF